MQTFDTIAPGEKNVLTFDMAAGLINGNLLNGTPTVTVTTYVGTDPSPGAILNGAPTLDATKTLILVPVAPMVDLTQYLLNTSCGTNQTAVALSLQALLPVSSSACC